LAEKFLTHQLDNGLTLLAQRMEQVSSAAMTIALPAGASHDPADQAGAAAVTAEWLLRGAGDRDSRRLNEALDDLGCQHHEDARSEHLVLTSAQLGRNLGKALGIYADIVRRPTLPAGAFDACRGLVAQSLDALEDEPMRMCNVLIREKFYPAPLGRNPLGHKDTLSAMTADSLAAHIRGSLTPRGTMLAVAGNVDFDELTAAVEEAFGDWSGPDPSPVETSPAAGGQTHLEKETAQAQIALAYPAATVDDDRYFAARAAQMVLSGGMGARLFTEVREKRALVYAVVARYHYLKGHAGVFVYAGTTPDRAQETLEVTAGELRRLGEGVHADELDRARTQARSHLVMQGESTSARSQALVSDWYHLGRLRTLAELSEAIDAVTVEDVAEYVRAFPAEPLTVLTIGPRPLDVGSVT
jgi:predicted Zn-dependent peptidase